MLLANRSILFSGCLALVSASLFVAVVYASESGPCGVYGERFQVCGPKANVSPGTCRNFGCITFECSEETDCFCIDDDECVTASNDPNSYCETSNYVTRTESWYFVCPPTGPICGCLRSIDYEDTKEITVKMFKSGVDMCER